MNGVKDCSSDVGNHDTDMYTQMRDYGLVMSIVSARRQQNGSNVWKYRDVISVRIGFSFLSACTLDAQGRHRLLPYHPTRL